MTVIQVLALEDSEDERCFITSALTASHDPPFQVRLCGSLGEVMEALTDGPWDLLLVDLCVPDSQGLDTFRAVHAAAPYVPIVVQSGLEEPGLGVAAVREGAQDYLVKDDMTAHGLVRVLRYALERARFQQALRESEERYALAMQASDAALWDWDIERGLVRLSPRWFQIIGRPAPDEEPLCTPEQWLSVVAPEDLEAVGQAIKAHLDGDVRHLDIEFRVVHADGEQRWVHCSGLAVRDKSGRARRMAGSHTDVTRRKSAEARLIHDALHDDLTGLPNRALFADRLEQAIRRSRRDRDREYAVLFLDLDRFKTVNDSLGHSAGDELLERVAERLRAMLRPADTVARLGGDEFAVLLEDVGDPGQSCMTAERIVDALQRPFGVTGREVYAGASIGIAHSRGGYEAPGDVVRDADMALYHAKRRGGACYQVFEPRLREQVAGRLELDTDLRRALERREFRLAFQPIVRLDESRVQGFEALLRWSSPSRGNVPPDSFIPLTEETGLIVPLGDWVLREACRTARRWRDADPRCDLTVSVNLSPRQLQGTDLVSRVRQVLRESRLEPSALVLELTETALMTTPLRVARILAELRGLGVGINIDDFGTGWSSLSYLRRFPVDRLKIDRSFVRGMARDSNDREIVRAILGLARSLNIGVVAEGIETNEQLQSLRLMGCELGQGFLFSADVGSAELDQPAIA